MQLIRRHYLLFPASFFVVFLTALSAQESTQGPQIPRDVDGWSEITWGTTFTQAQDMLASNIKKDTEKDHTAPFTLRLNPIKFAG